MWDEDFPDLSLPPPPSSSAGKPPPSASASASSNPVVGEGEGGGGIGEGGGKEDAALMRKPPAPSAADRLQDEFLREVEGQLSGSNATAADGVEVGGLGAGAPVLMSGDGEEEEETFYSIGGGGGNASDIGIIAYELVGTNEPLPGLPDVKFRRCVRGRWPFLDGIFGEMGVRVHRGLYVAWDSRETPLPLLHACCKPTGSAARS